MAIAITDEIEKRLNSLIVASKCYKLCPNDRTREYLFDCINNYENYSEDCIISVSNTIMKKLNIVEREENEKCNKLQNQVVKTRKQITSKI